MKKAFLILSLLFVLASCKEPYLGMSEKEFKSSAYGHAADMVDAVEGKTVYRFDMSDVNSKGPKIFKYYYFADGKLVEIHEDEPRVPDILIQHVSN